MDFNYDLLQPPFFLKFAEMNHEQAKSFLQWFQEKIPIRTDLLCSFLQATPNFEDWKNDYSSKSLNSLGKWFCGKVTIRDRSDKEIEAIYSVSPILFKSISVPNYDLTDSTVSLSIDIGMYLSLGLEKTIADLHWEIITKPKNHVNYHQPVLVGNSKLVFSPIHLMITYAYGIANMNKGPTDLEKLYNTWTKILKGGKN